MADRTMKHEMVCIRKDEYEHLKRVSVAMEIIRGERALIDDRDRNERHAGKKCKMYFLTDVEAVQFFERNDAYDPDYDDEDAAYFPVSFFDASADAAASVYMKNGHTYFIKGEQVRTLWEALYHEENAAPIFGIELK